MPALLQWPVKESLIGYISSLEDGQITVTTPAERTPTSFTFVASETTEFDHSSYTGKLSFEGTVRFTAYGGTMNIEINNPLVELSNGSGLLFLKRGGLLSAPQLVDVAQLSRAPGTNQFQVFLTEAGRSILGEQYIAGQELSPLNITVKN